MKCQRCPKPATLHITDVLPQGQYEAVHLCEECAKKHLDPVGGKKGGGAGGEADDLAGKVCEECGIKFVEFRNSGRLGCPHDYDAFADELTPLLQNIHGGTRHAGKAPRGGAGDAAEVAELAGLRRQLEAAVTREAYEEAARLRDRIRRLEEARP